MSDTARRAVHATQLGVGLVTAVAPERTVRALTPAGSAVPDRRIVRVLGLRQVTQGAVGLAAPDPEIALLGVGVDLLHAASLLPLIAFSHRYRASATASAVLALAAAAAGYAVARPGDDAPA